MHYTLYTNLAGRLKQIGHGQFDFPDEAFKSLAGDYYKIEIRNHQFNLEPLDEHSYQIFTATADYVLKRS